MFVIQTNSQGQIQTDMGVALLDAISVQNWSHSNNNGIKYRLQNHLCKISDDDIPIGTIDWIRAVYGIFLREVNLPTEFRCQPFVKKLVKTLTREELSILVNSPITKALRRNNNFFIKPTSLTKSFPPVVISKQNIYKLNEQTMQNETLYFCSEVVDIQAEWRAFMYDGKIIDVKKYNGSWDKPITKDEIEIFKCQIKQAKLPFKACTVDFARTNYGIEWVEIHNFIACGLYGFDNPQFLIKMLRTAWKEEKLLQSKQSRKIV